MLWFNIVCYHWSTQYKVTVNVLAQNWRQVDIIWLQGGWLPTHICVTRPSKLNKHDFCVTIKQINMVNLFWEFWMIFLTMWNMISSLNKNLCQQNLMILAVILYRHHIEKMSVLSIQEQAEMQRTHELWFIDTQNSPLLACLASSYQLIASQYCKKPGWSKTVRLKKILISTILSL